MKMTLSDALIAIVSGAIIWRLFNGPVAGLLCGAVILAIEAVKDGY
jgi:hypothetical protein